MVVNLAAPGQGSVAGIGASLTLVFMNNTTLATVGAADGSDTTTPTKVNFGSGGLDVNATQFVLNVNLATSGGIGSSGLGMGGRSPPTARLPGSKPTRPRSPRSPAAAS